MSEEYDEATVRDREQNEAIEIAAQLNRRFASDMMFYAVGGMLHVGRRKARWILRALKSRDLRNIELSARSVEQATEIRKLRAEAEEYHQLITRQGDLLTGVAKGLRGDPPPNTWWDHSDLPERAAETRRHLGEAQDEFDDEHTYTHELGDAISRVRGLAEASKDLGWVPTTAIIAALELPGPLVP